MQNPLPLKILLILFLLTGPSLFAYNPNNIARDFFWNKTINLPIETRPKAALVLSAGGARGFAHVGVLRVLTDGGFPIDCISGTSAGAFIGAFYSAGYPLLELWQLASDPDIKIKTDHIANRTFLKMILTNKLASSDKLEKFVRSKIGGLTFKDLKIPFSCSAMDIKTGEKIVFSSGSVSKAVTASMNLPGIFKPVTYRHRYLVDGGVIDYLPVNSVKKLCSGWIIASVAKGDYSTKSLENILSYYLQVIDIRGSLLIEKEMQKADFVIHPDVGGIESIELNKIDAAGESGVKQAYQDLNEAKESYILFSVKNVFKSYFKN